MNCRICGSSIFSHILSLGDQPLSSIFPRPEEIDPPQSPLNLIRCGDYKNTGCGFVQLDTTANLCEMYGTTYGYFSSLSHTMVSHLLSKTKSLASHVGLQDGDCVLDIGSNDGTLLNSYSALGIKPKRYAVDPSCEKFLDRYEPDILAIVDFFPCPSSRNFPKSAFKIITSIAMFYDLDDPHSFVTHISELLHPEGIWALELSYFPLLQSQLTFDQICHEHVGYYDISDLLKLFERSHLRVLDYSFNGMNGGSVYLTVAHVNSPYPINTSLSRTIKSESESRSLKADQLLSFRVNEALYNLRDYLLLLRSSGAKVYGFGASTKGNIILNAAAINCDLLPAIGDINPEKHGRVTPGSRIPIYSHDYIRSLIPSHLLVLVWHLRPEVIEMSEDFLLSGGKLIFPLPRLYVVDKTNMHQYLALNQDFSAHSFQITSL